MYSRPREVAHHVCDWCCIAAGAHWCTAPICLRILPSSPQGQWQPVALVIWTLMRFRGISRHRKRKGESWTVSLAATPVGLYQVHCCWTSERHAGMRALWARPGACFYMGGVLSVPELSSAGPAPETGACQCLFREVCNHQADPWWSTRLAEAGGSRAILLAATSLAS